MRKYIDIITEANRLVEGVVFDGNDQRMDRAFGILVAALNVHESAHQSLCYKLEKRGEATKRLDPRDSLNKWTPQQWDELNQKIAPYFRVTVENGVLTIEDATNNVVK